MCARVHALEVVAGRFWCSYAWVSLTQTAPVRPRGCVQACAQACVQACVRSFRRLGGCRRSCRRVQVVWRWVVAGWVGLWLGTRSYLFFASLFSPLSFSLGGGAVLWCCACLFCLSLSRLPLFVLYIVMYIVLYIVLCIVMVLPMVLAFRLSFRLFPPLSRLSYLLV